MNSRACWPKTKGCNIVIIRDEVMSPEFQPNLWSIEMDDYDDDMEEFNMETKMVVVDDADDVEDGEAFDNQSAGRR
ncbi:hypothetical protein AMTR_s00078p00041620 [Amborella trichopoda]|uniref:Uncharacterized protein n=1 Tax=Amborella trichopoda TaxID=13333 RepID=W1P1N4_AMBTC|nr:hypothetical protein AMTR_s00078p00041620 [Amborella trichopoda]